MSKRKTRGDYLENARVDERHVKHIAVNERVLLCEGKAGEERIKRIVEGDGTVYHFSGGKGAEAMVMVEAYADSSGYRRICHYKGEKDNEHLVTVEHSNGHITHYSGARHQEYKHRVVFASGNILYFAGERKQERKAKQVDKDGTITLFEGGQGSEHYSSMLLPNGEYHLYRGTKGHEKLSRIVESNGTVTTYRHDDGLSAREPPLRISHWSDTGEMVHHTDENPLTAMMEKNSALKETISSCLERAEKLHEAGDSNENAYLVMSEQLKKIHAAAASLFFEAKAGHRIETAVSAVPRLRGNCVMALDPDATAEE